MPKYGKKAQSKVKKAMHERKTGTLRSGKSGKKVTSRKQAIAIGLSEVGGEEVGGEEVGGEEIRNEANIEARGKEVSNQEIGDKAIGQEINEEESSEEEIEVRDFAAAFRY